ncbi:MAG: 4-hydroxy-3-methylbut-2-enyl diphosphate reductase [Oscillospiraceae bacterium]|jgi:4-hydroxy-3-methylbut-2-enyl diphosphate reductase|nr:4-hydroxy-3-methylbut-2-enyl diphosphate reductase [Oscillospiraceae bacterium]
MIHLAKTAGFCFGVNRAVEMVNALIEKGEKTYTLGPIIHNPQVVDDLERKGVLAVDTPADVISGGVLVIRSHGVPQSVYDELNEKEIRFVDATCPFVAKIHKIVSEASGRGEAVLIAGDAKHPEVLGIRGHCSGSSFVFSDSNELDEILKNNPDLCKKSLCVVAQTTYNSQMWQKYVKNIKKVCTSAIIFDTICSATMSRQQEAAELSEICDLMLVIGGRKSSNTAKLLQICNGDCSKFLIESAAEVPIEAVRNAREIGITAGASTPADVIKEVVLTVSEINNSENFEAMLEESFKQENTNGKVVRGVVVSIAPNEICVDVGRKQSGIVALEDLTDNPNLTTSDIVKVGDELDLMIMRTNDQEGYIYLSKRILDSAKAWDEIKNASPKIIEKKRRRFDDEDTFDSDDSAEEDSKEETTVEQKEPVIFDGVVTEVNKGGVIVSYKGVRVFVPASHATVSRNEPMEGLLRKNVQFNILEVTPSRKRAVGSIKNVAFKEKRAKETKFWSEVEVGKVYNGTVRSLTDYGAFVDLGGVDGLVYITELSWQRVSHPSDILSVGDVVEVYVKKIDAEKKKISLGYKKTEDNPWEIMKVKYPVGTVIEAKVVGTPDFGAFVNILPGIDGLVHISQLSTERVEKPTDVVKTGDTVTAVITEVDLSKKRVSLSIRQVLEAAADAAEDAAEAAEDAAE